MATQSVATEAQLNTIPLDVMSMIENAECLIDAARHTILEEQGMIEDERRAKVFFLATEAICNAHDILKRLTGEVK